MVEFCHCTLKQAKFIFLSIYLAVYITTAGVIKTVPSVYAFNQSIPQYTGCQEDSFQNTHSILLLITTLTTYVKITYVAIYLLFI